MFLFLVLPILGAGFYILFNNPYAFLKLHRYRGQLLYLRSIAHGLKILALAVILCVTANYYGPEQLLGYSINLEAYLTEVFSALNVGPAELVQQMVWFCLLSVTMMLTAFLWCKFIAWRLTRISRAYKLPATLFLKQEIVKDSPLDKLLFDALTSGDPVLLSLSSRKVYVGLVAGMGEPTEDEGMDQEVHIVPLMSGYRDTNTLNVHFEIDYRLLNQTSRNKLSIIVRQELIESASPFDFDVYREIRSHLKVKPTAKVRVSYQPDPERYTWTIGTER
ncbi:hypothetical protein [Bowmanella denitrificans]|uniref:hypothetical protein n=1 Tax=Bowmanella denitrificans TaxID=366582 RepID=UPI000C99CFC9|nr:hypothetical protein [Bowmanella denitrificans]